MYLEMKKIFLPMMTLFVCISCTNYADLSYEDTQRQKFEQKFTKTFGQPEKSHDWGFASAKIVDLTSYGNQTRSHNVNRNEWEGQFNIPANVTESERELVVAEFSKTRVGAVNENNVNWCDYFIYEVHKGNSVYKDGNGNDIVGSDHMNHLQVKKAEGDLLPPNNDCWEHANDFNNGNQNSSWGDINGATLMLNSGTLDFAYHNSTDSKYHSEYIIIPGEKIAPSLAGFYYVGFDFYATHPDGQEANKNMDVERDWVFNDWIIRISPAQFKNAKMIIAEDLAASESDFDYNDVVFTATLTNEWMSSFNATKLVAHITLLAAGGTMPLYIADKEVHEMFGVSVNKMVNTGLVSRPAVQFSVILGDADYNNQKSINDIPVTVKTQDGFITLQSNIGEPSEKLCVGTDYVWCTEREPIQEKYPKFTDWVTNQNAKWYNND